MLHTLRHVIFRSEDVVVERELLGCFWDKEEIFEHFDIVPVGLEPDGVRQFFIAADIDNDSEIHTGSGCHWIADLDLGISQFSLFASTEVKEASDTGEDDEDEQGENRGSEPSAPRSFAVMNDIVEEGIWRLWRPLLPHFTIHLLLISSLQAPPVNPTRQPHSMIEGEVQHSPTMTNRLADKTLYGRPE